MQSRSITLADVAAQTDALVVACSRCDSGWAIVSRYCKGLDLKRGAVAQIAARREQFV